MGPTVELEDVVSQCERYRNMLRTLVRIHLEIDPPTREIESDEPDWIFRLRKVCLHSMAINRWNIDIDSLHMIATEIRATYVQIDTVWKCMPEKFRLDEMDYDWWYNEARSGILATFDHPTPISLVMSAKLGGFGRDDDRGLYMQLTLWLIRLGLGYGLALSYLTEVLDADESVTARITEVVNMVSAGGSNGPELV